MNPQTGTRWFHRLAASIRQTKEYQSQRMVNKEATRAPGVAAADDNADSDGDRTLFAPYMWSITELVHSVHRNGNHSGSSGSGGSSGEGGENVKEENSTDDITDERMDKLCRLSRISLPQGEHKREQLRDDLQSIMNMLQQLRSVEVPESGVEPMYSPLVRRPFALRQGEMTTAHCKEDVVSEGGDVERVLMNATEKKQPFFMVPKVKDDKDNFEE